MKTVKDVLIKLITLTINQMLNKVIFPDKLKIAKITPLFTKDDETVFTNYRLLYILYLQSQNSLKTYFLKNFMSSL